MGSGSVEVPEFESEERACQEELGPGGDWLRFRIVKIDGFEGFGEVKGSGQAVEAEAFQSKTR